MAMQGLMGYIDENLDGEAQEAEIDKKLEEHCLKKGVARVLQSEVQ